MWQLPPAAAGALFASPQGFPSAMPDRHVTWTRPSNQSASAVPDLSLQLRAGAIAQPLGRLRTSAARWLSSAWFAAERPYLQRSITACTSKPAKAAPAPNVIPHGFQHETSVHRQMPP